MRRIPVFVAILALLAAAAPAARAIFSSPIHAGCYIAAPGDCRIRVDPFTVNVASGEKLVRLQLTAARVGAGSSVVYDWRPDVSNPVPSGGASTYAPAIPSLDVAAACGEAYVLSLQGQDTGDANLLNAGQTEAFTCPSAVP
ncbi:MAG: hypothetical protein DCC71_00910 [Proteobacteria bacterium]|nr:MAG: hypothetical protein DCC71_00910 [Pseudomonadota bacterium]